MKTISRLALAAVALFTMSCGTERGTEFQVTSPDGSLVVEVSTAENLTYKVTRHGTPLLDSSAVAMHFADGREIGVGVGEVKAKRSTMHRTIDSPLYRQESITEHYNQLSLDLGDGASVTFRVFDEGCAYRFETAFEGDVVVNDETAEFNFAGDPTMWIPYTNGIANAFQFPYTRTKQSEVDGTKPIILPLAVDCGAAGKALILEADMESYPGMFIEPKEGGLSGWFVEVPDSVYLHERRHQEKVVSRHDYIAATKGERTYPWRVLAVADEDKELPTNNLVYLLAEENRIGDCSWVKTGKVAWDWWNDWGIDEGVDFEPGVNNATYKYYIDFASKFGLEYVVLDEGWYVPQSGDLYNIVEEINLEELIAYAAERNVKLILWAVATIIDDEHCKHYADMGIAGFKVDFIDRDDQKAVDVVYNLAEMTARHKLVLDIHGVYKPTGLNRTYPNVINFEGVYGLEELKWSNPNMPEYDVTFPYIRMVQGPADYTPGAMRNATREGFKIEYYTPMSQGTRAHQVGLYVVCDAPIVMLCDAPTRYEAEPECTAFIAQMPTRVEKTEVLSGEIGEWIVTARKAGEKWFVGGLTNWTARQVEVDFKFLDEGKEYKATILADAADANENPTHHTITSQVVKADTQLSIAMAQGGGFGIIIEEVKEEVK